MRITTELTDPLLLPIEVTDLGDEVVTLVVDGEIDMDEAGELRAVLADASAGRHRTVLVDLSGVHFMGSSGIGVLAAAASRLDREGRRMMVRGCHPAIRRAFEVTGVDRHLDVE